MSKKVRIKKVLVLFISFFIGIGFSFSANAQMAVFDAANFGVLMANLPGELTALQAEVAYLNNFNWNSDDAQSQLQNLTGYLQQSGNLANNANSVATEFQQYYPGYKAPQDYQSQYQTITSDTRSALSSVMQVMASINSQADPMHQNENLQKIQMQVAGAQGTLQATQGLAQITAQLASNLEVLQKTVAAQASAQDAYYSAKMQEDASNTAGVQKMFTAGRTTAPKIGNSGESIHLSGQ